jgi:hypothetical protein
MLVTGNPLVEPRMGTAPPNPVYPVMVIAPLLVVKVNWACTVAGSANSSMSESKLLKDLSMRHSAFPEKGSSAPPPRMPLYTFVELRREQSSSKSPKQQKPPQISKGRVTYFAPVAAETPLKARRPEDEGSDVQRTMSRRKISFEAVWRIRGGTSAVNSLTAQAAGNSLHGGT